MKQDILRRLPSIDQLLVTPGADELVAEYGRDAVLTAARAIVDEIRSEIIGSDVPAIEPDSLSVDAVIARVSGSLRAEYAPSMRYAVNAAGIVLHTGLGRAMLAPAAVERVNDVIRGYSTLATDPETGQRGSRDVHYADLLCRLTGAEAATVVNNNAAATMIVLNTLAQGKEVIVSRGQLVEIGGSFRMPDVMAMSGAVLREVGTTNKTHLRDYANAISENTGAILRVHTSNYRIVGFTEEPSIQEMTTLAHEHHLPVIDDLGSGALIDLSRYGLESEPLVQDSVRAGADAVCFSGDKLIGGPQCGIIIGSEWAIKRIKKNPLARALRIGKMTVAALEGTLRLFLNKPELEETHPTYRMFSLTVDELDARAQTLARDLRESIGDHAEIEAIDGESQVGSGSVPTETLPSRLLCIRPHTISSDALARRLRHADPPVFARIHRDAVLFDLRTIQPWEDSIVCRAILGAVSST